MTPAPAPLRFTVPGIPVPKERPRVTRNRKTGRTRIYTPRATHNYEETVGHHALRAKGLAGWPKPERGHAYRVSLRIFFDASNEPDLDNVTKSVLDGMNRLIYHDDREVTDMVLAKRPVSAFRDQRVEVVVERLSAEGEGR
jgi:Holliday junction resolvase RusA-like endonuclease